MPGAGEAPATAKRKAADSRDSNADADREAGAAEQPAAKRTRAGSEDQAMSTCRQGGPGRPADGPMRGHGVEVVLPADKAAEGQEFDSGTREAAAAAAGQTGDRATPDLADAIGDGDGDLVRLTAALAEVDALLVEPGIGDDEALPMALDRASPTGTAEAAAAAPSCAAPLEELSMGAPAEAQATALLPATAAAAMAAAAGAGRQESALQPQCAIIMGAAAEAPEVSTSHAEPLPARELSAQYLGVRADLSAAVIPPGGAGVAWDHFPNHLGDGIRARLLALATLHLHAGAGAAPDAVRELPANSNRVLLGAANNCELYQERVIRALADKVQIPLLVADVYNLRLDEVLREDAPLGLLADELYGTGGGAFPPDPWEVSDEDDPFLRLPRLSEKKEGGFKDAALDTALALRSKTSARRGMPGGVFFSLTAPPGRQASGLAAAAAEAAEAAARARDAAKAATERAGAALERTAAAAAALTAARERAAQARAAASTGGCSVTLVPQPAAAEAQQQDAAAAAALTAARERAAQARAAASTGGCSVTLVPQPAAAEAQQQDAAAAAPSAAAAAATPQQPAASVAASVPAEAPEGGRDGRAPPPTGLTALPAASAAADGGPPPLAPAQNADASAAASRAAGPPLRRGDRVSYLGRVHPGLAAAQQQLDQLQAAISRVEGSSNQRARDYLPQLLVRRTLMAQSQRAPRMQPSGAPPVGSKGRVLTVVGDKVQVVFDEPFAGGASLPAQRDKCGFTCMAADLQAVEDKEDPLVSSLQALFDVIAERCEQGPLIVFIQNLDRLLRTHATDHFRKLEALLAALPPRCLLFGGYCSRSLARAEAKGREGGPPGLSRFFSGLGGAGGDSGLGGLGDEAGSLLDRFGRGGGAGAGRQRKSTKGKLLSKMLPNHIELHPPNQEAHAKAWKKMVEGDVAQIRQRSNRTALHKALAKCGCACDDWDAVSIADCQLSRKDIEQVVGVAVAQQLTADAEAGGTATAGASAAAPGATAAAATVAAAPAAAAPREAVAAAVLERSRSGEEAVQQQGAAAEVASTVELQRQAALPARRGSATVDEPPCAMQTDEGDAAAAGEPGVATAAPWTLRAEHLMAAAEALRQMQQEAAAQPEKKALQDVAVDQYEKQLLSEVIPPEEINVSFDDIGALEAVKSTLHEVVILPLQRPELFTRGALTKPTKGLLLFGPPGTGKTMLAKAVASESGAHFINVNMSAITSKWFGEGERLVRALFGLAHKLSPSVIFVDEIDSFLSKRGQSSNEHEALRKMKNEFMGHWDGLRTKQSDRVLVLAATNRPMDLDDAVIRRMPRRIFVPLPDVTQRERILQVILKGEDLSPAFDFREAATLADGYSGSDLKNLCIAAAYCPIREYLEGERVAAKAAEAAAKAAGGTTAAGTAGAGPAASASAGAAASEGAAAAARAAAAATPAALAAVCTAVAPAPVRLRPMGMADFKEALRQVTASTHADTATMADLKRWNDQFGEGGSRQKEHLHYYT